MPTFVRSRLRCKRAFRLRTLLAIAALCGCFVATAPNATGQPVRIENATIDPNRDVYVGDPLFLSVRADVNEPQGAEYFGQFSLDAVYAGGDRLLLETSSLSPIANGKFSSGLNRLIQVPETTCLPVCQLGGSLVPDVPEVLEATLIIFDEGGGEKARTVAGRLVVHSPGQVSVTPRTLTFSADQTLTLTVEGIRLTDTVEDGISVRFIHESNYDTALSTTFSGPLDDQCFAPLVCRVTVINDTTLEIDVNLALSPQARERHAGTYHVVVQKAERDEEDGFFRTLRAPGVGVVTVGGERDFTIDHIEVVQVVQDAGNNVPLVIGKSFAIRVFPKFGMPAAETSNVPVLVGARVGDTLTEFEMDGSETIVTNTPDRGNKKHSYNIFTTPESSDFPNGDVSVVAVINPECTVEETDCDNNVSEVTTVHFEEQPPLRVKYLPICIQLPGEPESCPGDSLGNLGEATKRMFPVADAEFAYSDLEIPKEIWKESLKVLGGGEQALLQRLEEIYFAEAAERGGQVKFDQLIGIIPDKTMGFENLGGIASGIAAPLWGAGQGRVSLVRDQRNTDWIGPVGMSRTVAHEIGHNLGLRHPNTENCKSILAGLLGGESGSGETSRSQWPHAEANIQEHGASVLAGQIIVGKPASHPDVHNDLMEGCGKPEWISPFHYVWLFTTEFQPTAAQPSEEPFSAPLSLGGTRLELGVFAFVGGRVNRDGILGEINTLKRFTGTTDPNVPEPGGEYCLRFTDGAGAMLSEHCFPLTFRGGEGGEELDEQYFSRLVSLPAGTAGVSLRHLGAQLDSITASANAPTVEIQSPTSGERWDGAAEQIIHWTGNDVDGDPLTYSLFYSPRGNTDWGSLAIDLGGTEYRFDPSLILGGSDVWFRVVASDGFQRGEAEVGPVDVVQRPQITLSDTPIDLGEVVVGQSIVGAVALRNTGSGPLEVTAVSSDSEVFEVLATELPLSVRAGSDREVLVRYTASAEGLETGSLSIQSSAIDQPEASVEVQGRGSDGQTPRIRLESDAIGFPILAAGDARTVAFPIRNVSLVDLEIEWELDGDDVFSAAADASVLTLGVGEDGFVFVSFAPSMAGEFQGALTVRSNDPDRPETVVSVSGRAVEAPAAPVLPAFSTGGIVSAANFVGGRLATEMWVTLFGENLADRLLVAVGGLPTSLGGTGIAVRDSRGIWRQARLQIVAPNQINFLIPKGTAVGEALIEVTNRGTATATVQIEVVAPGLFSANASGSGPAAATFLRVAADGTRTEGFTFSTASAPRQNVPIDLNPPNDQVFLSLFGTGFRFQTSVSATVGGVEVPVLGAIAQGQFDGLDQSVIGPLPASLVGLGEVEIKLTFDGVAANSVTVNIQ